MSNHPRTDLKEQRKREGAERLAAWQKLTPQQQLKELDKRPGESKKQRERLMSLIRSQNQSLDDGETQLVDQHTNKDSGRIKAKDRRAAERAKSSSR